MVDPQVQVILDELAARSAGAPPLPMLPVDAIRKGDLGFTKMCCGGMGEEAVGAVGSHEAAGEAGSIALRSYLPLDGKPAGALMFFHGGGFMMGGLDSHDHICRALCNAAGAVVVAVAYRLAPEHHHPAAFEDCLAATSWVADHAAELGYPAGRLAVSGDSAGGALAAMVAIKFRDEHEVALCFQWLIYPETSASLDWPSVKEFWEPGRMAAGKGMGFFRAKYFTTPGEVERADAFPDSTADLAGLPPALVTTAEIDPMRDMGEAYAKRLEEAGVKVTLTRYDGLTHVFLTMFPRVDKARAALEEGARAVRQALADA